MQNRSSKPPKRSRDPNVLAWQVVQEATGQDPKAAEPKPAKSPAQEAAALLGRLGGLKGGVARDRALSKAQKSAIAKRAARARWSARKPRNGA